MPYKYKHHYETVEDIEKEWNDVRKHPVSTRYGVNKVKEIRLQIARDRERYLEELEFSDQMAARPLALNVDLRNKYSIMAAIRQLEAALDAIEHEVFEVPTPPPPMYL